MVRARKWLLTNRNLFFLLLLVADALFIFLGIGHAYTPYLADPAYSLSRDRGYAEIFQYVQEYWIVGLFLILAARHAWPYVVWMLLFGYLLLDDSIFIHERFGFAMGEYFAFIAFAGLRPRDYGELIVSATIGLFFLLLIGFAYYRGTATFRNVSRRMMLYLLVLVFTGVMLDTLHIVVGNVMGESSPLYALMTILEDGGEMVIMSVICGYAFSLVAEGDSIRQSTS